MLFEPLPSKPPHALLLCLDLNYVDKLDIDNRDNIYVIEYDFQILSRINILDYLNEKIM